MKREKMRKKEEKRATLPTVFSKEKGMLYAAGRVTVEGVLLLQYSITLPAFSPGEGDARRACAERRLAAFYRAIAEEIWRACEERLFPFVRRAYEESDDPNKRYTFSRYLLTFDATVEKALGDVVVTRRAVLSRRGKVLWEKEFCERFSQKSGRVRLLLLSRAAARVKPKWSMKYIQHSVSEHTGTH